ELDKLRKELQKISEDHAKRMYNLLKGRALQMPTQAQANNIASLLRTPGSTDAASGTTGATQTEKNTVQTPPQGYA
ncbi:MAG: hypothetical protein ACP5MZ_03735, partial [Candidatus Micrarchaeia archaeon]